MHGPFDHPGHVGTLDGKHLYVADHGTGKTFRYDVDEGEEGALSNKTLFADSGSTLFPLRIGTRERLS